MGFLKFNFIKHFPLVKSRTCFYIGLISLVLQFVLYLILLQIIYERKELEPINECPVHMFEDIKSLASLSTEMGVHFIIMEENLINAERKIKKNTTTLNCLKCNLCKHIVLGFDGAMIKKSKQLLSRLVEENFVPITFYNIKPPQTVPELKHIATAIFLQKSATFQVVIIYPREDNSWWFGDIHSDPTYQIKLASINLTYNEIDIMKTEGVIERFEMVPTTIEEDILMSPKNINAYKSEIKNSKFVECNFTRAAIFRSQFGSDRSAEALRFRHKVWKMLSRTKTVFDSLGVVFWLSSGTVLGYYRECDIIAHSKDVDIGMWATSYRNEIITSMQEHGFHLKIKLGFPNDSLELSFIDQSGIKLDIFFFYKDGNSQYWNGGTQVKSGKKFKYTFPKFTLCWTLFKDLRVRVPCEMEAYIRANYGPNWFTPVKSWDWKSSPYNVQPNGVWRKDQLLEAVQLFV